MAHTWFIMSKGLRHRFLHQRFGWSGARHMSLIWRTTWVWRQTCIPMAYTFQACHQLMMLFRLIFSLETITRTIIISHVIMQRKIIVFSLPSKLHFIDLDAFLYDHHIDSFHEWLYKRTFIWYILLTQGNTLVPPARSRKHSFSVECRCCRSSNYWRYRELWGRPKLHKKYERDSIPTTRRRHGQWHIPARIGTHCSKWVGTLPHCTCRQLRGS